MPKIDEQIADIEKKMEQHSNRLRDLKSQATKRERKEDTRRKILYGAAYLVSLDTLSEDARRRSLTRPWLPRWPTASSGAPLLCPRPPAGPSSTPWAAAMW